MIAAQKDKIRQQLQEEFSLNNINQTPVLTKIVINTGVGRATKDSKLIDQAMEIIARITGRRPLKRYASKSIAGFSLREKMPIGVSVTLRAAQADNFIQKLIWLVLPRVRDFQGISNKAFDKQGNYSLGIKDHTIFPEIDLDDILHPISLQINFVFKNGNTDMNLRYLQLLGMPIKGGKNG